MPRSIRSKHHRSQGLLSPERKWCGKLPRMSEQLLKAASPSEMTTAMRVRIMLQSCSLGLHSSRRRHSSLKAECSRGNLSSCLSSTSPSATTPSSSSSRLRKGLLRFPTPRTSASRKCKCRKCRFSTCRCRCTCPTLRSSPRCLHSSSVSCQCSALICNFCPTCSLSSSHSTFPSSSTSHSSHSSSSSSSHSSSNSSQLQPRNQGKTFPRILSSSCSSSSNSHHSKLSQHTKLDPIRKRCFASTTRSCSNRVQS